MGSRRRRWLLSALLSTTALVWVPGIGTGHGVEATRFDAPVPLWLVVAGAGVVVAFTAAWLAVAADTHRNRVEAVSLVTIPGRYWSWFRDGARIGFLGIVAATLVHGAFGPQAPAENIATVFTWPVWLHGIAVLSILVGDPWRVLSPWATIHRGLSWLEGEPLALRDEVPAWVGQWLAVTGFVLIVGVVENVTVIPRSPQLTVVLVAVYALTMIGGAVLWGRDWLQQADPLAVYYRLLGRVAPITTSATPTGDTTIGCRPPWIGSERPVADGSTIVFVVATVYTVSFDGFANTAIYQSLRFDLRPVTGTGSLTGALLYLTGLVGFVLVFAAVCWGLDRIGNQADTNWSRTAVRVAPTILPIAAAYELAHNVPYVIRNIGQLLTLFLPGVQHIDLLAWLSVELYWGTQVTLITVGHIVAVVAAHHVLTDHYPTDRRATRAHLPLVALMVGYTVVSLWIISQPLLN